MTNATTVIKVMAQCDRLGFMARRSSAPPRTAFGGIQRTLAELSESGLADRRALEGRFVKLAIPPTRRGRVIELTTYSTGAERS